MHHPLHPFPISIFLHPQVLLHIRKSSPSLYTLLSGLVKICIQLNLGPDQTSNSCPCVQAYTTQPVTTGGPIQKYQDKTQILRVQATKNKTKKYQDQPQIPHSQETVLARNYLIFVKQVSKMCPGEETGQLHKINLDKRLGMFMWDMSTWNCRCDERSIWLYQI